MRSSVAVLIPSYGDGAALPGILMQLARVFVDYELTAYVVDDGSPAPLATMHRPGLRVVQLRHPVNLGQGAALETARQAAQRCTPNAIVVTFDADGQHHAEDALALVMALERGADVALGNRFGGASCVPRTRQFILHCARYFEAVFTGRLLADAHNGLRALSPHVARQLRLEEPRMAHATEIAWKLCTMKPALKIVEVQVTITYTSETLANGQRTSGAFAVLADLFLSALFQRSKS
jgi:polyprenyl-phospho-N-acetylgalactosaminyl synthase